jgi:3-deoxy-manno-octulosonate cytidylyltransferase (CMP-KDO synthetase)
MTSDQHISGTERIFEVVESMKNKYDYYINVQGDEPMMNSNQIEVLVDLMNSSKADIGTLYTTGMSPELNNPNVVKLITDMKNKVLYFSRSRIPFSRDLSVTKLKKHLGIYAFKSSIVERLSLLGNSSLEKIEMLEQLKWMEYGYTITAAEVSYNGFGIDTPKDYEKLKAIFKKDTKG